MKRYSFAMLVIMLFFITGIASAGSVSRVQWNYSLPSDNEIMVVSIPYIDVAAASNTSFMNLEKSTATLVSAATTYTLAKGDYTDTIVPRNLVIISSCNQGAAYVGSALVTGVDHRGYAVTETIAVSTFTSTAKGTGYYAWRSVTSIKLTTTSTTATTLKLQIGCGTKIGLKNQLTSSAKIGKVIEAGAVSTTYTVSTDYSTITFADAPDGSKDYTVDMEVGPK
jgi:hypothetical protein